MFEKPIRGNPKNPAGRNRAHPLSPEQRRKRKRIEADARAKLYHSRTATEQLAIIAKRRGESAREVIRLLKGVAA